MIFGCSPHVAEMLVFCWPLTVCTFGFSCFLVRASFIGMILTTDQTFLFGPTVFGRMTETLAVEALHDRNRFTKFFHLVYDTCGVTS